MKKRILGIDTGTNSLGWAVVDKHEDGSYSLVKKGSLIFQEGVKVEKGIESSKAAERTEHRATRKHYFRRRLRKIEVLKVLVKYNLCPKLSDDDLKLWHTQKLYPKNEAFMHWQKTNENEDKNPYTYRHICLHEKLNLNEESDRFILGRCLYHLAQRRGFLSNRLDGSEDTEENGKVRTSISQLSDVMQSADCEYLGDYFYTLYKEYGNKIQIRNRYTDREEHYKKEFDAICAKQQLPDGMKEELNRALYFQRPLKSQRKGVGRCTMEKSKQRCAESHPDYEEFRMWSYINNIKVKGPHDLELRPLSNNEINLILPKFLRKSNFDFEEIAKAIAGRNNYQYIQDSGDRPYKFNYRMTQSVSSCPTIYYFTKVFGEDWRNAIAESYTLNSKANSTVKSVDEMVNDVWNVLYSFSSIDKLREFGKDKLQLDDERAEKFSKIKLPKGFASLSLCALRKILPFLKMGIIYSRAAMLANIPTIIGKATWERDKKWLLNELIQIMDGLDTKRGKMQCTLDSCIKDIISNNYDLKPGATERLYHPSMIETYSDAKMVNGVFQLGSPRTNAIRNPMAMRSLHQLRKVINLLLKEKVIDNSTEVHIEYSRELNDSNMRQAIASYQKKQETKRKEYADRIVALYKEETGKDVIPTNDDILKFQLWEEQEHICLYTGNQIGIADFIGPNPKYDIEHTIPRSVGGDFTKENLTLCESAFNRNVKKAQIPSQLANHDDILARIECWKEQYERLMRDIDKLRKRSKGCTTKQAKDLVIRKRHEKELERDYLRGKYQRFIMTEIPEGFARRQGAGIGLISKYAGLYLKSIFHDSDNRNRSNVFVVKGATTAEFRKMWGIQNEYDKKSRDNHVHHCIDAITIACIGHNEYNQLAYYYHQRDDYEHGTADKPTFPKPWCTFAEDMKNLEKEILIVHSTPDNMPKKTRKYIKTSKGKFLAQGDTARGSLHNDKYYGAIERDGEVRYVLRKELSQLKEGDVNNIVDDVVREKVQRAIRDKGFVAAIAGEIYMNEEKRILIKKVRCYATSVSDPLHISKHRDASLKEYKQQFHVTTDGNYCTAIYEGIVNGNVKRTYKIVNLLEASSYYKTSAKDKRDKLIVPAEKDGLKFRCVVKSGTQIIVLQTDDEKLDLSDVGSISKRLYFVAIIQKDGRIVLRHSAEAREASALKAERRAGAYVEGEAYRPEISFSLSNFHALVEGYDFRINELGQISLM
ncbi:MAG: type II CRISPR RNA-guided endonuclease Cas9 [Prevotellaceae bacterium]|nr:type II CRISPR RNA-guided endonuclease Cas9 [Candidatus Colivivens equi]